MSYSATDDAEQVEPDETHDWRYQIGHAKPASYIGMLKQQLFRGHDLWHPGCW